MFKRIKLFIETHKLKSNLPSWRAINTIILLVGIAGPWLPGCSPPFSEIEPEPIRGFQLMFAGIGALFSGNILNPIAIIFISLALYIGLNTYKIFSTKTGVIYKVSLLLTLGIPLFMFLFSGFPLFSERIFWGYKITYLGLILCLALEIVEWLWVQFTPFEGCSPPFTYLPHTIGIFITIVSLSFGAYFIYTRYLISEPLECLPNCSKVDLSGLDLRYVNLSEAEFRSGDLSNAILQGAKLIDSDLEGANLTGVSLWVADLSSANLRETDLSEANLIGANFQNADLRGANLLEAELEYVNLTSTKVDNTTQIDDKWRLIWEIVNYGAAGRDLRDADLSFVEFRDINLTKADLRGANFYRSRLYNVNMQEVDLQGANLKLTSLQGANLSKANLSGVALGSTNLNMTNLQGANLRDTGLIKELWRANLRGADLRGIRFVYADLRQADLSGADLREVDLSNADLSYANLSHADLSNANLQRANLSHAVLTGTILTGAIMPDNQIHQ